MHEICSATTLAGKSCTNKALRKVKGVHLCGVHSSAPRKSPKAPNADVYTLQWDEGSFSDQESEVEEWETHTLESPQPYWLRA